MHIPDGYLSPQTCAAGYAVMAPFWAVASRRVKATLRLRQVPLLALGAAFTFVVMMFNVPIPGGTTGHAVGAVLVAILLGPWAAVIAVSSALVVQALLFGDGGITALGANCFNIAVVMPFVGWGTWRLVAGKAPAGSPRHVLGAALGGYLGLNAAALTTAVMFGLQPLIAHDAAGRPLYSPFGLKVAVTAIGLEHLLLFGFVEAAVTGLTLAWLQRADPSLLPVSSGDGAPSKSFPLWRLGGGLAGLVLLAPLGLYLPARLGAGSAWGEWSAREVARLAGFMPEGLRRLGEIWPAPLPDYASPAAGAGLPALSLWYVLSAALGCLLLVGSLWGVRRWLARPESP